MAQILKVPEGMKYAPIYGNNNQIAVIDNLEFFEGYKDILKKENFYAVSIEKLDFFEYLIFENESQFVFSKTISDNHYQLHQEDVYPLLKKCNLHELIPIHKISVHRVFVNANFYKNFGLELCFLSNRLRFSESAVLPNSSSLYRYHSRDDFSHTLNAYRNSFNVIKTEGYHVGFEIEKEDAYSRDKMQPSKILKETGFVFERDGSLNELAGFEIVSPIIPLYDNEAFYKVFSPVKEYIDANNSNKCGGHINISCVGKNSTEILKSMKEFIPLFYALYENRLNNTYCKAAKFEHYFTHIDKYNAFYLKNYNILEFRLPSAVKNFKTLEFRLKLLQICFDCVKNERNINQIAQMMVNKNSEIYKLLNTQFSHEKIVLKIKLMDLYASKFGTHRKGLSQSVKKYINKKTGANIF